MCDQSEIVFYGMSLWSFYDSVISTNSLNFDYYAYNKDERLASPKFKFGIYGKAAEGSKVNLGSSELYRFTYLIKSKILKVVKSTLDQMKTDQDYSVGCSYNNGKGKNIYVTLMWNSISNDAVVRFMIGEKEKTILESDKVYIPIVEFFSLCEILDQAFKNYITLCSTVVQENSVRRLYDLIETKQSMMVSYQESSSHNTNESSNNEPLTLTPENLLSDSDKSEETTDNKDDQKIVELVAEIPKTSEQKENEAGQSDFDSYLKVNRDTMELDMAKSIDQLVAEESVKDVEAAKNNVEEIIVTSKFIDKFCQNDFSKLEEILMNGCNEDLPFDSFVNTIKQFTDIDFRDGITDKDYLACNYCIARQVKTRVGLLIEKQINLPSSIAPIVIKNDKRSNDKLDTAYYLLLFYIYMSKVRTALIDKSKNSIDNKDLFTYLLKMVTNPLVFAYVTEVSEAVAKSEIVRRYYQLINNGFFNNFIENIKGKIFGATFNITENEITEAIGKIYLNLNKFGDKLNPSIMFDTSFMKLSYDDFNNGLSIDNLKKVIHLDSSLFKFKKINLNELSINSTDDLPVWILNKFDIKTAKFDTSIIQKYFRDNYKDSKQLEHISKINKNVYDILDELDLTEFDAKALRALYFWDTETLPKTLTYLQFKKMIDSSSLDVNHLISMIVKREKVTDPNFFSSFLVSAEDPFES